MEERTPPGTLCKGSITLTPKPDKYTKETITAKVYKPIMQTSKIRKILNKILVNKIQEYIKMNV